MKEEAIIRYRELLKNARTSSEILEIEKALSAILQERDSLVSLLEGLYAESGTVLILVQLANAQYAGMGGRWEFLESVWAGSHGGVGPFSAVSHWFGVFMVAMGGDSSLYLLAYPI